VRPQEDWSDATPPYHPQCRHQLTPLSAEEAADEGIDDDMPDVDLDEGWGDAPSKHGTDWDFDLSSMPADLRAMIEDSIAAGD
jgi:hypothetical protein